MNDKLKHQEQQRIISNYGNEIKQLVDALYDDFKENNDLDVYKQKVEEHKEKGILHEIKDNILLDSDQKDILFQKYYNSLADGCKNINNKQIANKIRHVIFSQLKNNPLFYDKHIVVEIADSKFREYMNELRQELRQKINEKSHISDKKEQNTIKDVKNIINTQERYQPSNKEQEVKKIAEIMKAKLNKQLITTFNQDDFYKYQEARNVISNATDVAINNQYEFIAKRLHDMNIAKSQQQQQLQRSIFNNAMLSSGGDDSRIVKNNILSQNPNININFEKMYNNETNKNVKNVARTNINRLLNKTDENINNVSENQIV